MGGNALKNTYTRRYNADEYHALCPVIVEKLNKIFPKTKCNVIVSYKLKESFGDVDVLVESDNLPDNYLQILIEEFLPTEHIKNGNCISLDFRQIQIDFIVTNSKEYETSKSYFAYNDTSNLLGRVAHTMGLKFGHDGLSYNWRIETYQFKNVVLLTEMVDILKVLGYDPAVYERGFDTLEDIFKYVVSSPFFNKAIYQLNNRNHVSRIRDMKRKTYMEFLKWIEQYEETEDQKGYSLLHGHLDGKNVWLPYLFEAIPGFEQTYKEVMEEWERAKVYKERFNGDLVREWTCLEGKELGAFMKHLRDSSLPNESLVFQRPEHIETLVKLWFKLYEMEN